jgi:hypothetical protein
MGIVACCAEGAALCYRTIWLKRCSLTCPLVGGTRKNLTRSAKRKMVKGYK